MLVTIDFTMEMSRSDVKNEANAEGWKLACYQEEVDVPA